MIRRQACGSDTNNDRNFTVNLSNWLWNAATSLPTTPSPAATGAAGLLHAMLLMLSLSACKFRKHVVPLRRSSDAIPEWRKPSIAMMKLVMVSWMQWRCSHVLVMLVQCTWGKSLWTNRCVKPSPRSAFAAIKRGCFAVSRGVMLLVNVLRIVVVVVQTSPPDGVLTRTRPRVLLMMWRIAQEIAARIR